jgi:hypothetical protein
MPTTLNKGVRTVLPEQRGRLSSPLYVTAVIIDRGDRDEADAERRDEKDMCQMHGTGGPGERDSPFPEDGDHIVIREPNGRALRPVDEKEVTLYWGHRVAGTRVQKPDVRDEIT